MGNIRARKPGGGRKPSKPEYSAAKNLARQMEAAAELYTKKMSLQAIADAVHAAGRHDGDREADDMVLQAILEGLGLGARLVLVCAAAIRKGAVHMVHLYHADVQARCVALGLTTREKIRQNRNRSDRSTAMSRSLTDAVWKK